MSLIAVALAAMLFGAVTADAQEGWYIAFGAGVSKAATMKQAGNNRDTTCYPDDECGADFRPEGYRSRYDLHSENGASFELGVGYSLQMFRIELSTTHQTLGIDQHFAGASYLDGSRIAPDMDSFYTVDVKTGVDDLTLHTLVLSGYVDLPFVNLSVNPYLGLGLGLGFAKLSGLYYESAYEFAPPPEYEGDRNVDAAMYNGRQLVDVSDVVATVHFHVGANYRLLDNLLLGLKVSYNLAGDMSQEDAYEFHAIEGLTNHTEFSGIRYWTVLLNLKRELRRDAL